MSPVSVLHDLAPFETDPFAGLAQTATIAIVGNRPEQSGEAEPIDHADRVIRFNNAFGFGGTTGCRVTDLVIVNRGGAIAEWLDRRSMERSPAFHAAERIILPIHPRAPGPAGSDESALTRQSELALTVMAARRFSACGKPVHTLAPSVFARAMMAIARFRTAGRPAVPSSGFLLAHAILPHLAARRPAWLHGFGFEGWDGHDFDAEERWFRSDTGADRFRFAPSCKAAEPYTWDGRRLTNVSVANGRG